MDGSVKVAKSDSSTKQSTEKSNPSIEKQELIKEEILITEEKVQSVPLSHASNDKAEGALVGSAKKSRDQNMKPGNSVDDELLDAETKAVTIDFVLESSSENTIMNMPKEEKEEKKTLVDTTLKSETTKGKESKENGKDEQKTVGKKVEE